MYSKTPPEPPWLVRLIERITGIDAVRYWRERHEGTAKLLEAHVEAANQQIKLDESVIRMQTETMNDLRERTIKAEVGLKVEQNTRKMLQNLVAEIGLHAQRNHEVAPRTILGVIHASCVEATQLAESWIATGTVDAAEIVNIRATMANRLLPDAKPGAHERAGANINAIVTERKRDGRAGDTAVRPAPDQLHRYEYDLFNTDYGKATSNANGHRCNLCGKPMSDPIHLGTQVKSSGSITAEKRPEDGPPQTLPPAPEMPT